MKKTGILLGIMLGVVMGRAGNSNAQTLTTLYTFCATDCDDGGSPSGVVEISPGTFMGATQEGGLNGDGTIFLITSAGTLTTIYQFDDSDNADGSSPKMGAQGISGNIKPVPGSAGDFYGVTDQGGGGGDGTVFRITTQGTLTTVYQFSGPDGSSPVNLIKGSDGAFYGTTMEGGLHSSGTVFQITSAGTLTTLHSFAGPDGSEPVIALQSSLDNQFYGTNQKGGTNNAGTMFKMTSAGTLTTLHFFNKVTEGSQPSITLQNGSNFYGTLFAGGTHGSGTVFQITSAGTYTPLYQFSGPDGAAPVVNFMDSSNTLYGATVRGGANGAGTAFKLTSAGTLTTLYSFCHDVSCTDGGTPSEFVQGSDGKFYGVTSGGGDTNSSAGTVFVLNAGLSGGSTSPFQIKSILRTNNNVLISWVTPIGSTNSLQVTKGSNGSYLTNNFAEIFAITNTVSTTTNYLDIGGATNKPSRYYRVRLVP